MREALGFSEKVLTGFALVVRRRAGRAASIFRKVFVGTLAVAFSFRLPEILVCLSCFFELSRLPARLR